MKIGASDSDVLSVDVVIPTFRRPEHLVQVQIRQAQRRVLLHHHLRLPII